MGTGRKTKESKVRQIAKRSNDNDNDDDHETKKKEKVQQKEMKSVVPEEDDSSVSVYDSGAEGDYTSDDDDGEEEEYDSNDEGEEDGEDDDDDDATTDSEDAGFEEQGSSDEEEEVEEGKEEEESDDEIEILGGDFESAPRKWRNVASTPMSIKRKLGKNSGVSSVTESHLQPLDTQEENKNEQPKGGEVEKEQPNEQQQKKLAEWMQTDDLSSDDEDEDGTGNRIGRVPLHWYDEYDHIGYDAHGTKVSKQNGSSSTGSDLLDRAIQNHDDLESNGKRFTVRDALNARDVTLTQRQLDLIRRVQAGAYAHPEFDANPDYVDYYSGVDPNISGINSDRHEPKSRFQPSPFEKMHVRKLLHRLKTGEISMDYLTGKVHDMSTVLKKKNKHDSGDLPFLLWSGNEEDELALRKDRPMHIAAPKQPPPGHAESYNPSEEYLPTPEEIAEWEKEEDPKDRPHGLLVPTKFPNLRSVGAYQHAVRERFERCLDLYLCPRVLKRRLNIDPESLVPSLPKASDLRPFPTSKCIQYLTPSNENDDGPPMIRCLTVSPDGQFMASGASDGYVRLWEVQTGRLLQSWNVSKVANAANPDNKSIEQTTSPTGTTPDSPDTSTVLPVVALEWNPNRTHHCLLAAVGNCAIVIATGTAGLNHVELTEALLERAASASKSSSSSNDSNIDKVVKWNAIPPSSASTSSSSPKSVPTPISAYGGIAVGPIASIQTNKEMTYIKWHKKGDYFVTVSPKAAAASVLIHQLSKASSQQPFKKNPKKGGNEVQCACFHPTKPFLFVASQQHIRVYHLVKQVMVKRLLSGCRWISSLDVHSSGDHVIVGSLDRRMVWFDLDLSNTPYKTLKYHERAIRTVGYHRRYPLMASSSDDGTIHVFHSTVYSDLMRNPLIVPVKILRGGHEVVKKLGVLSFVFHPTQPWLFSAGADGKIHLYQDI